MKINKIIKERRILHGLTQEQVANYLGVSTPAVNKWEKGLSYPDITILSSLARLLKIDLNTLLSFNDDLSDQEIAMFTNVICTKVSEEGFETAYKIAMDKIYEYPTCDKLILTIATILQGMIYMYGVKDKDTYEKEIEGLFERVLSSQDIEVRNQAISILIGKYLQHEEYDKAQSSIDSLPAITYDKKQLQGNLYIKSGELEKASEVFEHKLISAATEINTILISMIEIALKENRQKDAEYFAQMAEKTTKLYDLWEYNSYATYFQLYSSQKDAENTIMILEKMLPSMREKWDVSGSMLYRHIKQTKSVEDELKEHQNLFNAFVDMLKNDNDEELEFIKNNPRFLKLLNKYSN